MDKLIYVDHSATTYTKKEVLEKMLPYFDKEYGNCSSSYKLGTNAKKALDDSRRKVANSINANPDEIYFTSGGSESDNMIIQGIARANKHKGNHIITSKIEHHAVLETCKALEKEGFEVSYISPDENGVITPESVRKEIKDTTILVSIMYANNEIGTIEPIRDIANITKFKGIYFHTDAVQAIGNVKVDVKALGIDALSLSSHKFYGPKGVGAVYIKKNVNYIPLIYGGSQESKKRAGTENLPGIVGMAEAIEIANNNLMEYSQKLINLRDYVINRVLNEIPDVVLNGDTQNRLPGNVNFSFKNIDSKSLVLLLDINGIQASSGSACSSGDIKPSHVLSAINQDKEYIYGTVRITFGEENTKEDAKYIVDTLKDILFKLRSKNP